MAIEDRYDIIDWDNGSISFNFGSSLSGTPELKTTLAVKCRATNEQGTLNKDVDIVDALDVLTPAQRNGLLNTIETLRQLASKKLLKAANISVQANRIKEV